MRKSSIFHLLCASCQPIGGQAVIEGVMLRNGAAYGLAVRSADGAINAQRLPWKTCLTQPLFRLPFIRGFPILIETMVNGVHALNRSMEIADAQPVNDSRLGVFLSVGLAIVFAVVLFVAMPHLLSWCMHYAGFGGDVEGFNFHLWDGFYKCLIFLGYIYLISLVPDIRRVFQYHGAEHKVIHAWETGADIDSAYAFAMSRLHPRCGTTFLLFVITLSILVQAVCVPFVLALWHPEQEITKHAYAVLIKILLVVPISSIAYEMIRFAARLPRGLLSFLLQAPGLALQRLTTREPSREQLEVGVVALAVALGPEEAVAVTVPCHSRLDSGFDL